MKKSFPLCTLLIILTSCIANHQTGELLNDVEPYIQERPDGALNVLRTVSPKSLRTKALKAQYSLLYATALDKNYIDTTDLSVIIPAVEYYAKHGTPSQKMKAFFYQGCIYYNRGEDERAMQNYLRALEDTAKIEDNRYKELVNSAISNLYSKNYHDEQELQYTLDALRYGKMAGDSVGIWAITGHLASCYANMLREEEAEIAYQDFFAMPVYDTLTVARRGLRYAKDLLRKREPEPERSIEIVERIANAVPEAMTVEAYSIYAYAYQLIGNDAMANAILEQLEALDDGTGTLQVWRYLIYEKQGRYKEAFEDFVHCASLQDSLVISALQESITQSHRDYLREETEVLKKENKIAQQRLIIIVILSILLIGSAVLIYFRKKETLNRKMEYLSRLYSDSQRMLELQSDQTASANEKLADYQAALMELRKQFTSLYKAQYKVLNDLCTAYFSPSKKDTKEKLYTEAIRQLDIIINDRTNQDRFVAQVNDSLDGMIDKLRKDFPDHKEQAFHFLAFIIAGFDAATISHLTGYSVGTVYTKKNKLKKEIANLDSPYRDFYLQFFD